MRYIITIEGFQLTAICYHSTYRLNVLSGWLNVDDSLHELQTANDLGQLDIDFLLPNGICVPLQVDIDRPLDQIKQELWKQAANYPLFQQLATFDKYGFLYISSEGLKEDVMDESVGIAELRLAASFLKVVEKPADDKRKTIDRQINSLIGMKGSNYIQAQHSVSKAEISEFRQKMTTYCNNDILKQANQDPTGLVYFEYKHPCRLRSTRDLPPDVENFVINHIVLTVIVEEIGASYKLKVNKMSTPDELVKMTVDKWSSKSGLKTKDCNDYILQVLGMKDFLYGDNPLVMFKYVYSCIVKNTAPEFWLKTKSSVVEKQEVSQPHKSSRSSFQEERRNTVRSEKRSGHCVWDIHNNFYITLHTACNVQVPENCRSLVRLCVGVFHGPDPLCSIQETKEVSVSQDGLCSFNDCINFDIKVQDLPQMSRLCFGLHSKKGKEPLLLAWANIPIFDYKSNLQKGKLKLPLWPRSELIQQEESYCFPVGTVATNPQGDCSMIEFSVPDFTKKGSIYYPPIEKVLQCASDHMEEPGKCGSPTWRPNKNIVQQLDSILKANQYTVIQMLDEQQKQLIWWMRYDIRDKFHEFPHALLYVLYSVSWDNHIEVSKMQALLQTWPTLEADQALTLLDFTFPDKYVRKKATEWLDELTDEELAQYLLQLVQALKYENYLNCDLVKFLLRKALQNRNIGHKLFWLLKSDMHDPSVTVQYGLIIEIYLKANPSHMSILDRQQIILQKLKSITEIHTKATNLKKKGKEKDDSPLQKVMQMGAYKEAFCNIYSPITLMYKLDKIVEKSCKVMDSKKKPFWLEWTNADEKGQNIQLIYKCGDDLRQDMLTLQILEVMDTIWQSEGYDLRLNPYGCVATGNEEGMIEVVQKSLTLAGIQKWRKQGLDKNSLYDWLKHKNPSEHSLQRAVEEFKLSCAGYAVATYILGVGDRHNDNIMMKETGQLFHIDFGHFLGNKKTKFNIRRERVPFILTSHFEYVIKDGEKKPQNFHDFKDICERAYLIIRSRAPLLIQLFMMMLSSGIPQLNNVSDIDYIKEVLALNSTQDEALEKFRKKFKEAQDNSWSTTVNWWFHMRAH
ncbi:unnamed protein product [Mytilus coruscus]|uniref:Phosphatidylinositol-4,5-bisphosphate 3-kinase n=1 Tax=Mytilus coruscus TaxID=42192 RepID=A0A6J8C124_MYTCO|nr:unnamed protein product [Mytilus coruscus]